MGAADARYEARQSTHQHTVAAAILSKLKNLVWYKSEQHYGR